MISFDPVQQRVMVDAYDVAVSSGAISHSPSTDAYWRLSRDRREGILEPGDSPHEIGGRSTDLSQLMLSLENVVGSFYGEVPTEVAQKVRAMLGLACVLEVEIAGVIERMARDRAEGRA